MSDTDKAAGAASTETNPTAQTADQVAGMNSLLDKSTGDQPNVEGDHTKGEGVAKADNTEGAAAGDVNAEGDKKTEVPPQPELVNTPAVESANPPIPQPDQTANAQGAVEDDINLIPSAAQILDPNTPPAAVIEDSSQRGTPENVEAKFGPSPAEMADAQHSAVSPKPAPEVVEVYTPEDDDVPHPTLPHCFAAIGRLYNEAIALGQSLESHTKTLESEGEAEMHAVALRMKTLMDDVKTGVETIEAQMSIRVKAAIEGMSRF